MTLLLREALGESLRKNRVGQSRTLRDVSSAAQVSLGYLSEVERGQKEASSELLAAICRALELEIADVLEEASSTMRAPVRRSAEPIRSSGTPHIDRHTKVVIAPPALAAA